MHNFKLTDDTTNKYVEQGLTIERCFELAGDWVDTEPLPEIVQLSNDLRVWNDAAGGIGTKARWGDLLMSRIQTDEVVYVQPRIGWAGISLAHLAKKHGKKLTLFMPASKTCSSDQLVTIERGAKPVFRRIAAMPVLNKYAKEYAEEVGATFIPFGLDHELVVAAGVVSTVRLTEQLLGGVAPVRVASVVSTGVLTRTLQIAWPNATFHGVAVARNTHPGETGRAKVVSYHRTFTTPSDLAKDPGSIPFDTAKFYDMKGFEYCQDMTSTMFWNVAGNVYPERLTPADIDSYRDWGEVR